jgi:hypothetical protein
LIERRDELRKTTATTLMFAAGVQPLVVTQRLGHMKITTRPDVRGVREA